jgi:hypothetical protein
MREHLADSLMVHLVAFELFFEELVLLAYLLFVAHIVTIRDSVGYVCRRGNGRELNLRRSFELLPLLPVEAGQTVPERIDHPLLAVPVGVVPSAGKGVLQHWNRVVLEVVHAAELFEGLPFVLVERR